MFDLGWTELLLIACVAIIVVGPKDLPRMLRTLGQQMGKLRRMSREFQSTFNDALREAEKQADIADMKEQVEAAANFDPLKDLKKTIEDDKADGTAAKAPASPATAAPKSETESPPKAASAEKSNADPQPAQKPVAEDTKA